MDVDWKALAAGDFPFPQLVPAAGVAAQLAVMLTCRDPVVRDEQAYTALARWTRAGQLDDVLEDLGDAAAERFSDPQVQARTFAPLILDCVLTREQRAPGRVSPAAAQRWFDAFAAWYPSERDTRGWDDELGWLHAVAHGADAAAAFAVALPARRPDLLTLCAQRMTADPADRYVQLEDARLARAVTSILLAPGLSAAEATAWLDVVTAALESGGPGPVPPWAFNTFATLQSLHLHLVRGLADGGVPPHADAVTERVAAVLRLPYRWLG